MWFDDLTHSRGIRRQKGVMIPGSVPNLSIQKMEKLRTERAASMALKRRCTGDGCSTTLACDNKTGLCACCTKRQVIAPVLALGDISVEAYDEILMNRSKAKKLGLV